VPQIAPQRRSALAAINAESRRRVGEAASSRRTFAAPRLILFIGGRYGAYMRGAAKL
jgi:hypothetical protein